MKHQFTKLIEVIVLYKIGNVNIQNVYNIRYTIEILGNTCAIK